MASLTETARKVLMKEGMVPSISSSQSDPDRDTRAMNPNLATLRPGSRGTEARFSNPNAPTEDEFDQVEDLGGPVTSATDPNPYAKIGAKKDTSRSSQSAVGPEPSKTQGQGTMAEEYEISEELQAFIEQLVEEGYSDEQIAEAIEENFELVSEEAEESVQNRFHKMSKQERVDFAKDQVAKGKDEKKRLRKSLREPMKEHVDALLAGENLSEDFREKAETIFESAVTTRVQEEVSVLEEAYAKSLEEEVTQIHEQIIEQVDSYLNYVVEQWVKENEVAIESGLRSELTEGFISGLRNLFAEHYIDVPEKQVDVLEEMAEKLETFETRLNEEIEKNVSLTKMLSETKQSEIINSLCEGLTYTQAEKLKSLAENINFTNPEEFTQKVETLKESYFTKSVYTATNLDPVDDADGKSFISEELNGPMAHYVKAIGKTLK